MAACEALNELKRQRALVQEHLNWLDAQIRMAQGQPAEQSPSPAQAQGEPPPPPTPATHGQSTGTPLPSETWIEGVEPANLTSTTKIGCVLLTLLLCAGVLYLVFVLPYQLLGSNDEPATEDTPEQQVEPAALPVREIPPPPPPPPREESDPEIP